MFGGISRHLSAIITHLPLFIKLPRIDEIVPYGIETSGGSGDGGKEGVAEPDNEDGVLLSESLPCLHLHAIMTTYPPAETKLEEACHKRDYGNAAHVPHRLVAMSQGLACDGNGYGK